MKITLYPISWLFGILTLSFCQGKSNPPHGALKEKPTRKIGAYVREIKGYDEEVAKETIERGKVMISYSDCYSCHREDRKAIGPSFKDIDLRYPRQQVFIRILAQRIIHGGSGAWGYATISSHPKLNSSDAEAMVTYILSLASESTR